MNAYSSSRLRGDAGSVVRLPSGEATLNATEADALCTSASGTCCSRLARFGCLRGESLLSARCVGDATGERHGAVIRTSAVSAISRMSCRHPLAGARSRAQGVATATGSSRVETFVAFVRAPMQKKRRSGRSYFSLLARFGDVQSPNHAMQLTASKPAIYVLRVCHPRLACRRELHRARGS
jgi:hypothetical protein